MTQAAQTVPAHVPSELVVDVDVYDIPGGNEDPQLAWNAFRKAGPLSYSPHNGGHWVATTGPAVFEFFRDVEHFSSKDIVVPKMPEGSRLLPINADGVDHAEYRRNIMGLFTPDAVEALSDAARQVCVDFIEEVKPRGECEFVQDFAFRFPLTIFLQMMGLPLEDRMYLRKLVEQQSDSPDPEVKGAAHVELQAYIDRWIERRIAEPADDAVTMITRSTFRERPYTREEMRSTILLLLHAGLDTVAGMLGFITRHLAANPDQADLIRASLDDGAKMHQIVQELVRRFAIPNMGRILARDYEYEGVLMKEGDMIMLAPSFFNMDDARMEKPEAVDFDRRNVRHISFGSGPHTCAGALLARKEIRIFLEEWLTRIPSFRLDPERPPKMRALPLNAVSELWLKW